MPIHYLAPIEHLKKVDPDHHIKKVIIIDDKEKETLKKTVSDLNLVLTKTTEENAKLIQLIKDGNRSDREKLIEEKNKMLDINDMMERARQIEAEAIRKSELAEQLIQKAIQLEQEIKKNSLKKPINNLPRVAMLSKKK